MTAPQPEKIPPICVQCKRQAKTMRLPAGWKRHRDTVYCDRCWKERYLLRAISMPVASPEEVSWEDLRKLLKMVWSETTRASNWMTTQLYVRDIRREPGVEKLPPMQRAYLYPEARKKFPSLPPQSVVSIEHSIQKKYRQRRYELLWTSGASLPSYRYPTPFPVHNQSWSASIVNDRPIVSVRLGEGKVRLRLKSGPQFFRQMQSFRAIVRGEAVPGELALYQQGSALMCKLVAWLPRPAGSAAQTGILRVRTAADNLLTAFNQKDETVWCYNGDHLRRWAASHKRQLQRWAEDAKYENRPVPSFAERRKAAVEKFHARMDSATHEIAAQVVGYAARRRFGVIEYDDHDQSFCDQFSWHRLKNLLAEKLDVCKIELRIASAPVEEKSPESLAEGEDANKS